MHNGSAPQTLSPKFMFCEGKCQMIKLAFRVIYSFSVLLALTGLAAAQTTRYAVQLEAAPAVEAAQEKVKQLKAQGLDAYIVKSQVPGKGTFYRIRVGNFPNQADARKFGADLQKQGVVRDYFIAPYEQPQTEPALTAQKTPVSPVVKEPPIKDPPVKDPPKETTKQPLVTPPVKEPQATQNNTQNNTQNIAVNTSPPTPASTTAGTPGTNAAPPAALSFVKFQDPTIGYSFDRPQTWEGGQLDPKDAQDQKVNAGALFKSSQDSAFISAIWNNLDKANSPDNDNDLIVEVILKSMGSGDGTQQMNETSRRVVSENGLIKTYLDLRATFKVQGQEGPLDFLGKAVIVRASKGILLVVAFYSKTGPPYVGTLADKVVTSVQIPE